MDRRLPGMTHVFGTVPFPHRKAVGFQNMVLHSCAVAINFISLFQQLY